MERSSLSASSIFPVCSRSSSGSASIPMSGTSVSQRPSRCCALRIRNWRTSATSAVLAHRIISAASSNRSRASHRRSSVRSEARPEAETGERKGKKQKPAGWLEILKKEERRNYEELVFNVFIPGLSGLLG